jgi:hypothetical protein
MQAKNDFFPASSLLNSFALNPSTCKMNLALSRTLHGPERFSMSDGSNKPPRFAKWKLFLFLLTIGIAAVFAIYTHGRKPLNHRPRKPGMDIAG